MRKETIRTGRGRAGGRWGQSYQERPDMSIPGWGKHVRRYGSVSDRRWSGISGPCRDSGPHERVVNHEGTAADLDLPLFYLYVINPKLRENATGQIRVE